MQQPFTPHTLHVMRYGAVVARPSASLTRGTLRSNRPTRPLHQLPHAALPQHPTPLTRVLAFYAYPTPDIPRPTYCAVVARSIASLSNGTLRAASAAASRPVGRRFSSTLGTRSASETVNGTGGPPPEPAFEPAPGPPARRAVEAAPWVLRAVLPRGAVEARGLRSGRTSSKVRVGERSAEATHSNTRLTGSPAPKEPCVGYNRAGSR